MLHDRASLSDQILSRAAQEPDFRTRLLANPKQTVAEAFDLTFPDDFTLEIRENTASSLTLVLPARTDAVEISDLELDAVAGGCWSSDSEC